MPAAARQNDTDDKGHTIKGAVSTNVFINGVPAATQDSLMDDGAPISSGTSSTVRINGKFAAYVGSTTGRHPKQPNAKQPGSINRGSPNVNIGSESAAAAAPLIATASPGRSSLFGSVPPTPPPAITPSEKIYNSSPPVNASPRAELPLGEGKIAPVASATEASDIIPFLNACLKDAHNWIKGKAPLGPGGNTNIVQCFKDCGYNNTPDTTPWCAAFVNFVLKRCGYYATGDLGVIAFIQNPSKWKATVIFDGYKNTGSIANALPGDIAIFMFPKNADPSHVCFVYTNTGSKLTFCGGNQAGVDPLNNNPAGSTVSISFPGGMSQPVQFGCTIRGIIRPTKRA